MRTAKQLSVFLLVLLICFAAKTKAQEFKKIIKKEFRKTEEGFGDAWKDLKRGDKEFKKGKQAYKNAIPFYTNVLKYNSEDAQIQYRIGLCYLYKKNILKSIIHLEKAIELDDSVTMDIKYFLGRAYHQNYQFDKAIETYADYKSMLTPAELSQKDTVVRKRIEECENGKELVSNSIRVFVDNMGNAVNSSEADYNGFLNGRDSSFLFTTRRKMTNPKLNDYDYGYFEESMVAFRRDNVWKGVRSLGEPINIAQNDAVVGVSPDGNTVFIYMGKKGNGDLYTSTFEDGVWKKPEKLPKKISTKKYHESSATITADGNTLYFVSNRESDDLTKSYGGHDIFVAHKDSLGKWGDPSNLGSGINTPYEETSVYISPDGNTLYFSSQGHTSMGGFDVFVTEKIDTANWSAPKNMGYPVNTVFDEFSFSMPELNTAYYSSIKEDGFGKHDIYQITFLGYEKPSYQSDKDQLIAFFAKPVKEVLLLQAIESSILRGIVRDAATTDPLAATVDIVDIQSQKILTSTQTDPETGFYSIPLPQGKELSISVKSFGYMFYSDNIVVKKIAQFQIFEKNIMLKQIAVGQKVILKNIFFDTGKNALRPASFPEIDALVVFFKDYPNIIIEISGHTDNVGNNFSNKRLSLARAKAVAKELIDKGVSPDRIKTEGYASEFPVAPNTTEEGRQLNRRVEAKILEK